MVSVIVLLFFLFLSFHQKSVFSFRMMTVKKVKSENLAVKNLFRNRFVVSFLKDIVPGVLPADFYTQVSMIKVREYLHLTI